MARLRLKLKLPETYKKLLYNNIAVVHAENVSKKTAKMRKMTRFLKVAKLAILQSL